MATNKHLYERYLFFKKHAGYIVGECAEVALALARAEEWALAHDVIFYWQEEEYDHGACLGDHEYWCSDARRRAQGFAYNPHETCSHSVESCEAYFESDVDTCLASLGSIIDPSNDYRRVIEAELALEAWDMAKYEMMKA